MREDLQVNQVRAAIQASAFSLPNDIDQALKLLEQKGDVSLLTISLSCH